jgi:hypothetical protein
LSRTSNDLEEKMRRWTGLAIAGLLVASPTLAHESGGAARGILTAISSDSLKVRTQDGHEVQYAVTAKTRFSRGTTAVEAGDLKSGERVVVRGARDKDRLVANEVRARARSD